MNLPLQGEAQTGTPQIGHTPSPPCPSGMPCPVSAHMVLLLPGWNAEFSRPRRVGLLCP